jgi:hypothetical protein
LEKNTLKDEDVVHDIVEEGLRQRAQRLHQSKKEPCMEKPESKLLETATYNIHFEQASNIAIGDRSIADTVGNIRKEEALPTVYVTLLTRTIPTAYCTLLDVKAFPLVTVRVDNTGEGCTGMHLRAGALIESYSDMAVTSLSLVQGQQGELHLLPLLKPSKIAELNDIRAATLRVTVEQIAPESCTLYDQTKRVQLHARDTALLAVESKKGGAPVDLTRHLAAWVTPRHPKIEQLLRQAAEYHVDRRFVGYQGARHPQQREKIVRDQARAIFTSLRQDAKLTYINSCLSLGQEAGQITQRVRLPAQSLATSSSANCIDGTVLFASLLELASIDPVVVIVPGHAFVGWRIWQGLKEYEFLETTLIGYTNFEHAQRVANAQFQDALSDGFFDRELFDPLGFGRLIDVAECRATGIYPLE